MPGVEGRSGGRGSAGIAGGPTVAGRARLGVGSREDRAVRVRPMAARDVPHVATIEAASFGREAWPAEEFRALRRAFAQARPRRGALWSAVDSRTDEVLGYVGVEISALRGEADIINIAVGRAHRRRGVGQALVARVFAFCRRRGVELLWLRVRASNRGARRFYRYLGFAERGRFADYYQDPDEPAVIMAVEVGPMRRREEDP